MFPPNKMPGGSKVGGQSSSKIPPFGRDFFSLPLTPPFQLESTALGFELVLGSR